MQEYNVENIFTAVRIVFLVNVFLQAIQYIYYVDFVNIIRNVFYDGRPEYIVSIIIRSPGLFNMPNTAAMLSVVYLYMVVFYNYDHKNVIFRYIMVLLAIFSIYVTHSATAMIVLFFCSVLYLMHKFSEHKYKITMLLATVIFFLYFFIENITGRIGLIEESFGARIIWFIEAFENVRWLEVNIGQSGNLIWKAHLEGYLDQPLLYADSFYTMVLISFGKLFFFMYCLILIFIGMYLFFKNHFKLLVLLSIIVLFSVSMTVVEVYPLSLILAFLIALEIKQITTGKSLV